MNIREALIGILWMVVVVSVMAAMVREIWRLYTESKWDE